jgi:transcriptional regulator with XRE-family HTH domain
MLSDAYPAETLRDAGERLRQLRKEAGLTQTELASRVGMRQEALSRFESGHGPDFSAGRLLKLLHALGHGLDFVPLNRRPTLNDTLRERREGLNVGPHAR